VPQYVILMNHSADTCPSASERVRKWTEEALADRFPKKCAELGVQISVGPLHLDPSHRTLTVAEAPSIEAVNRALQEGGLIHFNEIETFSATPVPELLERMAAVPRIFD
jgi:Cys-tRNA synthase (O-phospho-L-seryl-tRNA:Cys-tRNA synthase)